MIRSFSDKQTARLDGGQLNRRWPQDMQRTALKKLRLMHAVAHWTELANPPGNDLHALSGDRAGQYAIRINMQWRIAFTPNDDGSISHVEVTDYH